MVLREFEMQIVHRIPENLQPGLLYVCFDCNVVAHLCACGCGEKVVLPIDPQFWSVRYDGETVTLSPSIGNYQYHCKSHYWIKENRVIWVDDFASTSKKKTPKRRKKKRWLDRLRMLF